LEKFEKHLNLLSAPAKPNAKGEYITLFK